jgi:hypothetical protein
METLRRRQVLVTGQFPDDPYRSPPERQKRTDRVLMTPVLGVIQTGVQSHLQSSGCVTVAQLLRVEPVIAFRTPIRNPEAQESFHGPSGTPVNSVS